MRRSSLPAGSGTLEPPLKWAGGKRWLVPQLKRYYEPGRRLVEPFAGGLAVALGLRPARALLNDINLHLVNLYRWLQKGLVVDIPMANNREVYYRYRARFNELVRQGQADTREAALLFYYLNRTGYNGLCRFNTRGEFNVPFGKYKHITYRRNFLDYQPVLAPWEFRCGDFQSLVLAPDDFVYADPPYDVEFTKYAPEDFTWNDQVRLAKWLARHPGPVLASNQATERICHLYTSLGFTITHIEAPRRLACTGDRTPALEILAWKSGA